jgi:hypothetical protein
MNLLLIMIAIPFRSLAILHLAEQFPLILVTADVTQLLGQARVGPYVRCACLNATITTVIPGARTVARAKANAAASGLPLLGAEFLAGVRELYDRELRAQIHDRW